jgi:CRISPR system Cascade subunit CasE
MYLSRLILNPRDGAVRRDIGDLHATHQRLLSAFQERPLAEPGARAQFGLLYRVDQRVGGPPQLLVQSRERPDWAVLPKSYLVDEQGELENPACKLVDDFYAALAEGLVLRFRLRANPTRRIDTKSGPDGKRRNGKRVELRGEEQWLAWLARKGEQHGFTLQPSRTWPDAADVRAVDEGKLTGRRTGEGEKGLMTMAAVQFNGILSITNLELFRLALAQGIGSAKAYGFGLLSVARTG